MAYIRDTESSKVVPVHEMKWDAALQSALPAFHAVTGCDTVSQFAGHGKVQHGKHLRITVSC